MNRDIGREREALRRASALAESFLDRVAERPVAPRSSAAELRSALGGPLPESGSDPVTVVEELARGVEGGLLASAGPRFFGFVIGGSLPAAVAADWLTSAWDQNAGLYATSAAASVAEEVAAAWLLELFGLPAGTAVGFVTGCQMANFAGIAAGRHAVLRRAGWDVEDQGLQGAPPLHVVVGDDAHVTIFTSLRMLGLGGGRAKRVAVDGQGRMRPDDLRRVLASCDGPTIVCAQAGNVNTGAFDPFDEIVPIVRERGAWLHVDGAFGMWAAASPQKRELMRGAEHADSWATDGHKWLNVPYDCGLVLAADPSALRSAMTAKASYLIHSDGATRDPFEFTPEFSRRARGFTTYAALRSLGRKGVAELVERCCRHATRMAERLAAGPGVRVLNEVVLNQVRRTAAGVRLTAPNMDPVEQALRPLRIVVAGMLAGLATFATVALMTAGSFAAKAFPQLAWMLLVLMVLLGASTATGYLAVRSQIVRTLQPRIAELRQMADPAPALLEPFRRLTVTGAALAEGPAFFALIAYMLTAHPVALGAAGLAGLLVAAQFPSRARLQRFAERVFASSAP